MNLLVTKMLLSRGYAKHESPASTISDEMLKIFPPAERYEPLVREIFQAMGKRQLATVASVSEADVRLLLMGQVQTEDLPEPTRKLKAALELK